MKNTRIVLFTSSGTVGEVTYSFLSKNYSLVGVVLDIPMAGSGKRLVKRRIKRLGFLKVFLQLIFMKAIVPFLKIESSKRQKELLSNFDLNGLEKYNNIFRPNTINDVRVIDYVNQLNPDLVIVNGTSIIKKNIIENINTPLLNMHAGITPKYRGVHGGYWALVNKDKQNCGVTVHLVDAGIDTGGIICQKRINPTKNDNYVTYPLLQLITGLECIKEAVSQNENGKLITQKNGLDSKLYYHPTIIDYFYNRVFNNIK